jgi:LuxR family maltose regulon positive regulatory protein
MATPILTTKLYVPPTRAKVVHRSRLIARLNEGLRQGQGFGRKLTLVSAAAGFGKTTLVSEWVAAIQMPAPTQQAGPGVKAAWLSLDGGDSDPTRFLTYLVAALQTVAPHVGQGLLAGLAAPQPPSPEAVLTSLLNDVAATDALFLFVLDDYHAIDAPAVDHALAFLLDHLPPQLHLVIASREDPPLPLARLRARGQLVEVRAADLRFTPAEAAEFLNQVMGLKLAAGEVAALENRTEGWIAGLHLAALSMQERDDTAGFIAGFSGSHRFVLDYLMEEVLQRQPAGVHRFLLRTSILNRLCGPLCDAVVGGHQGQEVLAYLERANLFIVPLDNERRWVRYHHLFGELLRQRLSQQQPDSIADLHLRASAWFEENGLELEAFHHATAAHDIERAERLMEGKGMPLQFRGGATPILHWLATLPNAVLDAHPALWVAYASALLIIGQVVGVEEKARAAEIALQGAPLNERTRDLIGRIASLRVTVAVTQHDAERIISQAHRALEHLHPANAPVRASITWALGYAHYLRGERAAARQAYTEALASCQAIGHIVIAMMAAIGLARLDLVDNQLHSALQTCCHALELAGDPPRPPACDAHLNLAMLFYEWNDLENAQHHGQLSAPLARQIENTDRFVVCLRFLARLKLVQGDAAGAAILLAQAEQAAQQQGFAMQLPEIAAVRVLLFLQQGNLTAAAQAVQSHDLPLSMARVHLAQGQPTAALTTTAQWRRTAEARDWADERLKAMVLEALAHQALGEKDAAVRLLVEALTLAEPGGFVRTFVDEGPAMETLLISVAARRILPDYTGRLLAAFAAERREQPHKLDERAGHALVEPLSARELEVLRLVAQGFSNQEIGERLFLALDTVKGHNRRIFEKLDVQRRTEAVARARELGLL